MGNRQVRAAYSCIIYHTTESIFVQQMYTVCHGGSSEEAREAATDGNSQQTSRITFSECQLLAANNKANFCTQDSWEISSDFLGFPLFKKVKKSSSIVFLRFSKSTLNFLKFSAIFSNFSRFPWTFSHFPLLVHQMFPAFPSCRL